MNENPALNKQPSVDLSAPQNWRDYALLDSGNGQKLEKYGPYKLIRPEPEAFWQPALPEAEWQRVDAIFKPGSETHGGHWKILTKLPERWEMEYNGLRYWVQPTASRHVGVFPEQASHWDWLEGKIRKAGRPVKVLNLFGYTGLASLAAARAGAQVTHLDASPRVVQWGRENQALSGLESKSIRWIKDDAMKFVKREARRASFYDGIMLDPPKFGRGPQGEVWEFYDLLGSLLEACRQILTPNPLFLIITAYAVKASSITLYNSISEMMRQWVGATEAGELVLEEKSAGRLLSTAVYARWGSLLPKHKEKA
jgi:23S rRNA (cytosine1962-C5)-methyltransferase